jgi:ABC-type antimicrobial peptide transport system permease subunit
MRARADVRARPLSLVLVTVLVGVVGGLAITALSAARRTDSAYARYRSGSNAPEALLLSCPNGFPAPNIDLAPLLALPEVSASAVATYAPANLVDLQGRQLLFPNGDLNVTVAGLRDQADERVLRPQLLAGRYPQAADEVAVGWFNGEAPRPAIGDSVDIQMVPRAAVDAGKVPTDPSELIPIRVHVVGEVLMPGELTGDSGDVWTAPSFFAAHRGAAWTCSAGVVQLRHGLADTPSFLARVYDRDPDAFVFDVTSEAVFVSRTTHLDAIILRLLAILAAIAGVMILGQSLVRRTALGAIDTPVLRALGMTRRQMVWGAAIPALIVAAGGMIVAVAGSLAVSPLFPTGLARVADPSHGIHLDVFASALGVGVIVVATVLSVIVPAMRLSRSRGGVEGTIEYGGAERRSSVAAAIARLPLPPSAGAGARLALEPGHGRTATPVRSAIFGLALAVAGMVAAFGFASSMDYFTHTPRLWGLNFEFGSGQPFMGSAFQDRAVPAFLHDPGIGSLAAGNFQQYVTLEGPGGTTQEAVWGLAQLKGHQISTTMLEGRWPRSSDEVALARETLSRVGLEVGDTVTVQVAGTSVTRTIVGVPVFPDFGFGPGLGRGVAMTMDGLRAFYPGVTENLVLGDFASGADPATVLDRLNTGVLRKLQAETRASDVSTEGTTVAATARSRALPLQLSVLFALAAFATLVHLLLTSVRRRRRDLAILQTLGFRRRQVAATVAWQALTLATIALLIGVPLGMLLGRLGWAAFAYRLGVVSEPVRSPLSVLVIPVTLVVALLVSLGPGLVARRVRPAEVLKAE